MSIEMGRLGLERLAAVPLWGLVGADIAYSFLAGFFIYPRVCQMENQETARRCASWVSYPYHCIHGVVSLALLGTARKGQIAFASCWALPLFFNSIISFSQDKKSRICRIADSCNVWLELPSCVVMFFGTAQLWVPYLSSLQFSWKSAVCLFLAISSAQNLWGTISWIYRYFSSDFACSYDFACAPREPDESYEVRT